MCVKYARRFCVSGRARSWKLKYEKQRSQTVAPRDHMAHRQVNES